MKFRIKYTVKCKLQNFFNKEMIVKECLSELHAKSKLDDYCRKKYGIEYLCIVITSCEHENDIMSSFENIFGKNAFGSKDKYDTKTLMDLLKNVKKK